MPNNSSTTMDPSLLQFLRCPIHHNVGKLKIVSQYHEETSMNNASKNELHCKHCGQVYPIIHGIPNMLIGNKFNNTFLSDEKKQWDEHASKYDFHRHNNPVYMSGITTAVNNLSLNDKDIVLDACVGTGLSIKKYPIRPARTIAFDLSFESLRILQKGSVEIDFVQGDIAKLPFADSIFDKVLFANALQHLPKESLRRTSINQISRVSWQNSRIVISTHNFSVTKKNRGWSKGGTAGSSSGQVQYIYRYELDEFRSLLQSYLIVDRIIGAGFPLPYKYKLSPLSRIIEKFLRRIQKFAIYGHMLIGVCQKPQ